MSATVTVIQPEITEELDLRFPPNFVWGAATAAFQIEGAANQAGRGESIWDRFCATPGKVLNGDNGNIACDHYNRWQEDINLMKTLGLNAYRFSVSWSRVLPDGTKSNLNQKGLDFYDRLVDGLLTAGIEPYLTLYHWDMPQALEEQGGWANRATAYHFADFTEAVVKRLGDRVKKWVTHNEPWCASFVGYREGEHAPGKIDPALAWKAVHHLLLSHGLAVPLIRQLASGSEVGITLNLFPIHPFDPNSEADNAVARQVDAEINRLFLDPLFYGSYPADYLEQVGNVLPVQTGDMTLISTPLDFLGVNYYHRHVVKATPEKSNGWETVKPPGTYTTMGWEVYPEGLFEVLTRLQQAYHPKAIYITENGASGEEEPDFQGQIHDQLRLDYVKRHLHQLNRSIQHNLPVKGYFAWSLLDNFEWAWGYSRRFGLVHVDFATQKRTVKASGHWYSRLINQNHPNR